MKSVLSRCGVASIGLGMVAAMSVFSAPVRAERGVHSDRVVLGQSAKLSGVGGTLLGRQYRDGLLLAFDAANRAGGVHGRRIELVSLDDQISTEKAVANTRALIDEHQAFALVGHTFTNTVKAVIPIVNESGIPFIAPYTGYPELYENKVGPNVFVMRASFEDELATLIKHIDTVAYERIAMVHYANPLGEELRQNVEQRLQQVNRHLVGTGSMALNAKEPVEAAKPAVEKLAAVCPKVIVLGVSGRDAAAVVRGMNATPCRNVRYLARGLVDIAALINELGPLSRGIMVTQVMPNPFRRSLHPLIQDYEKQLRHRGGAAAKPDFAEFEGYIAGRFVVQALRRAGRELDRRKFIAAMESETLDGPEHYRVRFGPNGRVGSRYINIVMISDSGRITD